MQAQKVQTLVVGATGQLGSLITKHCLKQPNLVVNVLIRNPNKDKDLIEQVKAQGGNVIVADMEDLNSLKDSTKGIHTIISALIGSDKTVLEGQRALLKDAEANGVSRFLASDFSLDYRQMKPEEHKMLAQRIAFREDLDKSPVKRISVFNGVFMETFWHFLMQRQQPGKDPVLGYFGEANYKFDTTTYEDVARFVAAIVSDPNAEGDFEIIGQSVTDSDITQIYEKVKGKKMTTQKWGTYEDLVNGRDAALKSGDFGKYIWLAYTVPTVDGRGKLHKPKHQDYGIKTTTVEEFLQSRPDL